MIPLARFAVLALLLLFAVPARAEWHRASTAHFDIYAEGSAAEVRARAERLEKFDAVLRRVSGIDPERESRPLAIFFLRDAAAIQRLLGGGSRGAEGFYSPRAGGSLAGAPAETRWTGEGSMTSDTILFHEYSHHFLLQNFAAAYPPWFVEGFAEFYATAAFGRDGSVTVGGIPLFRVASLRAADDISAADLLTTGALDLRSRTLDRFYAKSWLLVHYLTFNQGRTGQRARYVRAIELGDMLEQAALGAFGDLGALDAELRRYAGGAIPNATVAAAAFSAPAIAIETLTPLQVALLPLRIEHMRGVAAARLPAFAATARAIAARHPSDPEALFFLAEAEGLAGNRDASERAADALLALVPTHSRALLRKARNLEARGGAGARRAARPLIVRANRADPRDPLPLIAYYGSFGTTDEETVPAIAVDGLLLAVQLAPQSSDVRLIGGAALARAGRLDEAEAVLRPAAFAPHGGAGAAAAQALLQLIAASRPAGTPSPELAAAALRTLAERLEAY